MNKSKNHLLFVSVDPLWELEYTGISNVVLELAKRFLANSECDFEIKFTVFGKIIASNIIETCVKNQSGRTLQELFHNNEVFDEAIVENEKYKNSGKQCYGLFLHKKPDYKIFLKESFLFYDFSFLLTQECHTTETVRFHVDKLPEQIESTDLFFCISESTANDLRWLFDIPKERVVVSLLGRNINSKTEFDIRKEIEHHKIEPYFLILGTIEPRKNISIILEWINRNPDLLKKYRFVFVGRDGWGASFLDYVNRYNLLDAIESKRILHLGYVDEIQKTTLIMGACLVFYPSIFEGFGLPVLEAMSLGTIVIASCSTSIPEVLGDDGYYFDPYSVESLDQAFSEFLFDETNGYIDEVRKNIKERAATFNYDKTYSVIYDSLCSHFL
jgi:glycosyltransferase involved in cell wall biosynthesis